jgi:thiol-disulfide isomerase/thioredoxin
MQWGLLGLGLVLITGAAGYLLLPSQPAPTASAPTASAPTASAPTASAPSATSAAISPAQADGIEPGLFQKLNPTPDLAGIVVSDGQGADVDLGRYKGKALLVNIWATWCPPCVAEMPSLNRLQAKLGSDQFAVVTVAVDEPNIAAVQDFMAKYQLDRLPVLLDANRAIDGRIRMPSLPASLLVSPEGKILARFTGENKWDCGKPFSAVQHFIASGVIADDVLEPCAD